MTGSNIFAKTILIALFTCAPALSQTDSQVAELRASLRTSGYQILEYAQIPAIRETLKLKGREQEKLEAYLKEQRDIYPPKSEFLSESSEVVFDKVLEALQRQSESSNSILQNDLNPDQSKILYEIYIADYEIDAIQHPLIQQYLEIDSDELDQIANERSKVAEHRLEFVTQVQVPESIRELGRDQLIELLSLTRTSANTLLERALDKRSYGLYSDALRDAKRVSVQRYSFHMFAD